MSAFIDNISKYTETLRQIQQLWSVKSFASGSERPQAKLIDVQCAVLFSPSHFKSDVSLNILAHPKSRTHEVLVVGFLSSRLDVLSLLTRVLSSAVRDGCNGKEPQEFSCS